MNSSFALLFLPSLMFLMSSCASDSHERRTELRGHEGGKTAYSESNDLAAYSAWYCPDNVIGFPAVNVKYLSDVPAIDDRLPTEEETKNGTSLMYIDTSEMKHVRPMAMNLPRLARHYSNQTRKNELIIVIQAIETDQDSLLGFRYINGGNGSASYSEVTFLSTDECDSLGDRPFISIDVEIQASAEQVWKTLMDSGLSSTIPSSLGPKSPINSAWRQGEKVSGQEHPKEALHSGKVSALWKNKYLQVDYLVDGEGYVEKYLLRKNEWTKMTSIQIISGPHLSDYQEQHRAWMIFAKGLKKRSEEEASRVNISYPAGLKQNM